MISQTLKVQSSFCFGQLIFRIGIGPGFHFVQLEETWLSARESGKQHDNPRANARAAVRLVKKSALAKFLESSASVASSAGF